MIGIVLEESGIAAFLCRWFNVDDC